MDKAVAISGALVLFIFVALLVSRKVRVLIARKIRVAGRYGIFLLPCALLLYNAVLITLTKSWHIGKFSLVVLYFALPTAIIFFGSFRKNAKPLARGLMNLAVILFLWLPVEFKIIQKGWAVGGTSYPLVALSALVYCLLAFSAWRGLRFNLSWSFRKKDLLYIFGFVFAILILILPVALEIGFTKFRLNKKAELWPLFLVGIWFAPALVEEIIFRGVIQTVLVGWLKPVWGIIVASVIFGLAHINNKAGLYGVPNWPYVVLASVVGIAYGVTAYKRNLQSSTTLHCIVDFVWWLLFKAKR